MGSSKVRLNLSCPQAQSTNGSGTSAAWKSQSGSRVFHGTRESQAQGLVESNQKVSLGREYPEQESLNFSSAVERKFPDTQLVLVVSNLKVPKGREHPKFWTRESQHEFVHCNTVHWRRGGASGSQESVPGKVRRVPCIGAVAGHDHAPLGLARLMCDSACFATRDVPAQSPSPKNTQTTGLRERATRTGHARAPVLHVRHSSSHESTTGTRSLIHSFTHVDGRHPVSQLKIRRLK